jgi:hypothetical protein
MVSKRGNQVVNGATTYVSNNKYIQDGQFIFDPRAVSGLAAGDDATVTWTVTIVKTTGSFDDQGNVSGTMVNCGAPSSPSQILLHVKE